MINRHPNADVGAFLSRRRLPSVASRHLPLGEISLVARRQKRFIPICGHRYYLRPTRRTLCKVDRKERSAPHPSPAVTPFPCRNGNPFGLCPFPLTGEFPRGEGLFHPYLRFRILSTPVLLRATTGRPYVNVHMLCGGRHLSETSPAEESSPTEKPTLQQ